VKLIDFGVARLNEIANLGTSLTSTHHLIGSVGYMAPEQLEYAKGVGPTADLYAIGVVIFRCLSGRLPFIGRSFEVLTKLKMQATPPVLSSLPGVPPNGELDAFRRERDPRGRFESATAMTRRGDSRVPRPCWRNGDGSRQRSTATRSCRTSRWTRPSEGQLAAAHDSLETANNTVPDPRCDDPT
jgi:serine/threonine protein kinase